MRVRACRTVLFAVAIAGAAFPAASAAATPTVHAHRGGALSFGAPVLPENTLLAFQNTAERFPGTWLELDSVVSSDGVPFVIHDSTLDRTTDCDGPVHEKTAAEIEACRVDVIGVSSTLVPAAADPAVRVPRLDTVLALARERGLSVNVEIKRIPGDPGYVPGDESFAIAVLDVMRASGIPRERMIVQSFDPTNLDTARRVLPQAQLSFLTLAQLDSGGPAFAAARGYDWVSPGSVPSRTFVQQAHDRGLRVAPYTLNKPDDVKAAAAAGVDALITDDPAMARQALGIPEAAAPAPTAAPGSEHPAAATSHGPSQRPPAHTPAGARPGRHRRRAAGGRPDRRAPPCHTGRGARRRADGARARRRLTPRARAPHRTGSASGAPVARVDAPGRAHDRGRSRPVLPHDPAALSVEAVSSSGGDAPGFVAVTLGRH